MLPFKFCVYFAIYLSIRLHLQNHLEINANTWLERQYVYDNGWMWAMFHCLPSSTTTAAAAIPSHSAKINNEKNYIIFYFSQKKAEISFRYTLTIEMKLMIIIISIAVYDYYLNNWKYSINVALVRKKLSFRQCEKKNLWLEDWLSLSVSYIHFSCIAASFFACQHSVSGSCSFCYNILAAKVFSGARPTRWMLCQRKSHPIPFHSFACSPFIFAYEAMPHNIRQQMKNWNYTQEVYVCEKQRARARDREKQRDNVRVNNGEWSIVKLAEMLQPTLIHCMPEIFQCHEFSALCTVCMPTHIDTQNIFGTTNERVDTLIHKQKCT